MLAYSGAKVQSRFYPGDLVTSTGDRKITRINISKRTVGEKSAKSWDHSRRCREKIQKRAHCVWTVLEKD